MNLNLSANKIVCFLITTLRIQLFVTLVALPVLVYWGLAISSLTIIGNIIFAPLLTIFLLISSLIFFLEILYLPNTWLIYLLEKLTYLWLTLSPTNPKRYLLFFPKPTWVLFLSALCLAIYLLSLKISKSKQVLLLSLVLLTSVMLAKLKYLITTDKLEIQHRKSKMQITYLPSGSLILHDYGILNQRYGIDNWLCYKLLPALIKNFGTLHVQELHLYKPQNQFTQENLKTIGQNLEILKIHP